MIITALFTMRPVFFRSAIAAINQYINFAGIKVVRWR